MTFFFILQSSSWSLFCILNLNQGQYFILRIRILILFVFLIDYLGIRAPCDLGGRGAVTFPKKIYIMPEYVSVEIRIQTHSE